MIEEDKLNALELLGENEYLHKEIKRLNIMLEEKFMKEYPFLVENGIICKKNKEIERLNNNWNKLEQWIEKEYDNQKYYGEDVWLLDMVVEKIKELKGDDKE